MANAHALEENTRDVIDPLISKKKLAVSAFRPAAEAVRIRSFSTHPKPNGYGSTRRTGMFWFIFIRPWYQ